MNVTERGGAGEPAAKRAEWNGSFDHQLICNDTYCISSVFSPVDRIMTLSSCYFLETRASELWLHIYSPASQLWFDASLNHISNSFGLTCFQPGVKGGHGRAFAALEWVLNISATARWHWEQEPESRRCSRSRCETLRGRTGCCWVGGGCFIETCLTCPKTSAVRWITAAGTSRLRAGLRPCDTLI